jgi:dolichol-phosphate mannosyltransferase
MAIQLFIGGVVLITLGINGIYTGRVYSEVKSRPLFIVQEKLEK